MSRLAADTDPLLPAGSDEERDAADAHQNNELTNVEEHLVQEPNDDDDSWSNHRIFIATLQCIANIAAHILSVTCLIVVIWWISLLGGVSSFSKKIHVFNWHPLLMITAFCFMTVAALAFRNRRHANNRNLLKLTHGVAWAVAALCAIVALIAVFQSHNDASVRGKFSANLFSLHSWIGVGVIFLYMVQFCMGVFTFATWPLPFITMSPNNKACIMRIHKFLGPFIYNCTAATILLGIQEKEGSVGCSYSVSKADLFPPQHFFEIPYACRVSHLLGILVLAVTLCTNLALHEFKQGGGRVVDNSSSSQHEL